MVRDNINQKGRVLQVMSLGLECFKYCQEFLVMNVVIQFQRGKSVEIESDWMEFRIRGVDREDCSKSVIGDISFDDDL